MSNLCERCGQEAEPKPHWLIIKEIKMYNDREVLCKLLCPRCVALMEVYLAGNKAARTNEK